MREHVRFYDVTVGCGNPSHTPTPGCICGQIPPARPGTWLNHSKPKSIHGIFANHYISASILNIIVLPVERGRDTGIPRPRSRRFRRESGCSHRI